MMMVDQADVEWEERIEVLTKKDHLEYQMFARDFCEDMVEVAMRQVEDRRASRQEEKEPAPVRAENSRKLAYQSLMDKFQNLVSSVDRMGISSSGGATASTLKSGGKGEEELPPTPVFDAEKENGKGVSLVKSSGLPTTPLCDSTNTAAAFTCSSPALTVPDLPIKGSTPFEDKIITKTVQEVQVQMLNSVDFDSKEKKAVESSSSPSPSPSPSPSISGASSGGEDLSNMTAEELEALMSAEMEEESSPEKSPEKKRHLLEESQRELQKLEIEHSPRKIPIPPSPARKYTEEDLEKARQQGLKQSQEETELILDEVDQLEAQVKSLKSKNKELTHTVQKYETMVQELVTKQKEQEELMKQRELEASVTSPPCRRQLNASLESGSPLLSPLVGGSDGGIGSYELELQVSELKEELEKIKGEKNALQEEFDNLAFAAEDIKTRYEETKILKENYRLHEFELKENLAKAQQEARQWEEKFKILQKECDNLLEKANKDVADLRNVIIERDGVIKQLQAELQQKEVAQRNAAQEMEKLQKQLQAEIAKGKELAAKLENSEQSRKSAADRVKAYERDMHDKLNRIMELQTECATLERKLEESEEVKTQLQEHINASKESNELEDLKAQKQAVEAENMHLKAQLFDLRTKMEASSSSEADPAAVTGLMEKISALEEQLKNSELEKDELREMAETLLGEVELLSGQQS